MARQTSMPVKWGNSLFVMETKTDTGAILDFEPFTIEVRDDIKTIYQKVDQTAAKMIKRTLPKIAIGKEKLRIQDKIKSTRYCSRSPENGKIELSWSGIKINDYVRALTHPYPGAYVETKFGRLYLWEISVNSCKTQDTPGYINIIKNGEGLMVKVGVNMCVLLKRVSFNGMEMWADDWARDIGLQAGDNILITSK